MNVKTLTTAAKLLAALKPYRPAVEADALVFDSEVPEGLDPLLKVLHTGCRALLTGNPWYGERSDKPGLVELDLNSRIPRKVTLLCVSGDRRWDRLSPEARVDCPELFESEAMTPHAKTAA
jgi:hypothetical protein